MVAARAGSLCLGGLQINLGAGPHWAPASYEFARGDDRGSGQQGLRNAARCALFWSSFLRREGRKQQTSPWADSISQIAVLPAFARPPEKAQLRLLASGGEQKLRQNLSRKRSRPFLQYEQYADCVNCGEVDGSVDPSARRALAYTGCRGAEAYWLSPPERDALLFAKTVRSIS